MKVICKNETDAGVLIYDTDLHDNMHALLNLSNASIQVNDILG